MTQSLLDTVNEVARGGIYLVIAAAALRALLSIPEDTPTVLVGVLIRRYVLVGAVGCAGTAAFILRLNGSEGVVLTAVGTVLAALVGFLGLRHLQGVPGRRSHS